MSSVVSEQVSVSVTLLKEIRSRLSRARNPRVLYDTDPVAMQQQALSIMTGAMFFAVDEINILLSAVDEEEKRARLTDA